LPIEIKPTANVNEAFKDINVAILVGAMPRREGMERKDLLKANVRIFKAQGEALDKYANKNVKVRILYLPNMQNGYCC
jgi:malate dehydrogenase